MKKRTRSGIETPADEAGLLLSRWRGCSPLAPHRHDHSRGLPVVVERESVGEFLSRWLAESVKPSVRPLTFDIYEQHVNIYLCPALGKTKLPKLTAADVQRFLNRQLKRGLAPRTVQLSLVTLRRALKQAERWGLVARNPAMLVDGPHVPRHEIAP